MIWGYSFTHSDIHNPLAEQRVYFPPKAALAHAKPGTEITPSMIPSVSQYAGQQLLTGLQAKAYADHTLIVVHLSELPYGGVYSKISAAALANPTNAKLKALEQASFQEQRSAGCCSRRMPSQRSAGSCSGGRSPRSA